MAAAMTVPPTTEVPEVPPTAEVPWTDVTSTDEMATTVSGPSAPPSHARRPKKAVRAAHAASVSDRAGEPRRALPLAVRLVTIYALVVGAALLVVAALAVQLTRSQLNRQLETRMVAVADSFADGPAAAVTDADQLPDAARQWLQTQPAPADQAVIIRTATGEVLSTQSDLELGDVDGAPAVLASNESGWTTLDDPAGSVRVLDRPSQPERQ